MVANTNYQDDTLLCDNFPTSLTAKGELFKVPTGFEDITRHYHDLQLKFRGTGSEKVKLKGSSTSKLSSSSEQQTTWSVEGTFNSVSSHGSLTYVLYNGVIGSIGSICIE